MSETRKDDESEEGRSEAPRRLSGQDASFLVFESPTAHMHVAGTSLFEAGPLLTPSGGIDIERIRAYISSRLHLLPRYRHLPLTSAVLAR